MEKPPATEQFELKLWGNGVNIERKVSHLIAAEIMSLVLGARAAATQEKQASGAEEDSSPQLSLREYLDKVKAVRKPDQIVAIGNYITSHEAQPTFSRDDVKILFASAKEPMPANFPRDFGVAIKSGMIASAHQKSGHFYITKTGIHAVERNFSDKK